MYTDGGMQIWDWTSAHTDRGRNVLLPHPEIILRELSKLNISGINISSEVYAYPIVIIASGTSLLNPELGASSPITLATTFRPKYYSRQRQTKKSNVSHAANSRSISFYLTYVYKLSSTPWVNKKQDTILLHVALPDINRFSKFFHCQTQ